MGYGNNSFLNNGKLYANGDNYINMGFTGDGEGGYTYGVFTNNGSSIHMEDGDVNDTLTIYGDFAGTGRIVVDASGVSMTADRLYIEGDVATNTSNVIDVFMPTAPSLADILAGDEIEVVTVSGTSTAANFNVGIVKIAVDSLYNVDATLVKDINVSGSTDRFSLTFDVDGLSTAGAVASSISPAVQSLWNLGTGTLFQREGTQREFKQNADGSGVADVKGAAGVWARYFFGDGSLTPDSSSNFGVSSTGNNFDMDASGWEAGAGYAFNSQWAAGVLGGTSSNTVEPDAGGRTKIDGTTWGLYVTYTPGNGFYADLSYRAMDFDGSGEGGQTTFGYEGSANGYNLEFGYGYKTSSGWIIEPQLQWSSVSVDLDSFNYQLSDFRLDDGDSSLLRIGAAFRKNYETSGGHSWTPYAALSYLDETSGTNSYVISNVLTGDVDTSGASALLELGATAFIKEWGVSAGLNWRDGSAYDSVLGGQLSVRYDW
jgi:outer membrane autotransporter protein